MILVYNAAKGGAVFVTGEAVRKAGCQTLIVPEAFSSDTVECFPSLLVMMVYL